MPRFVVVTGLPGSGKSTLGRKLSTVLSLPLLDKDDILEGFFEQRGIGDSAHRKCELVETDSERPLDVAGLLREIAEA